MQYKTFAVVALSAGAIAAPEKRQASYDTASVDGVLATAIPASLLAVAITNSAAVYSQVASEFAAGETPAWYSSLPDDIKSILAAEAPAVVTSVDVSAAVSSASASVSSAISSAVSTASVAVSSAVSSESASVESTLASITSSVSAAVASVSSAISAASSSAVAYYGNSTIANGTVGSAGSSTPSVPGTVVTSTGGAASLSPAMCGMSLAAVMSFVGILVL